MLMTFQKFVTKIENWSPTACHQQHDTNIIVAILENSIKENDTVLPSLGIRLLKFWLSVNTTSVQFNKLAEFEIMLISNNKY